MGGLSQEDRLF
jgi:hypothetical protein